MLSPVPWIWVTSDVEPGPSVESAVLDPGDVVGHQIVAEAVPLVHRRPQVAGAGVDGDSHGIADSVGEASLTRAIGVELENAGAVHLRGIAVGVVVVGF